MGRPPIGARALTAAEKQRRYRERKFGNKAAVTKPNDTAELEARIRELEDRLAAAATARALPQPKPADDPAHLPKSYRERFEALCRRQAREFEDRVKQSAHAEASRLFDEFFLPNLRERLEKVERQNETLDAVLNRRKPLISKALWRKALACLHPDSRAAASEKMFNEVFAVFSEKGKDNINKIEIALCGKEADRPQRPPTPTLAEIMAARERVRAENSARAKRAAATRRANKSPT